MWQSGPANGEELHALPHQSPTPQGMIAFYSPRKSSGRVQIVLGAILTPK